MEASRLHIIYIYNIYNSNILYLIEIYPTTMLANIFLC